MKLSFQFQMSKKEREICESEMDLKNYFCLRCNLSNDNMISAKRPGLKWVRILEIWSENGWGKSESRAAAHPQQEFPGVPPPPPAELEQRER